MESINSTDTRIPDDFQSASAKKRTGQLQILSGEDEYKVYFQNGRIIDVENGKNALQLTCQYLNSAEFLANALNPELLTSYEDLYKKIQQDPIASAVCDKDLLKDFILARIMDSLYHILSFEGGYTIFRPQGVIRNEFQPSVSVGQLLLNSLSLKTEEEFVKFDWDANAISVVQPGLEFNKPDQRILQFSKNSIELRKLKSYALVDRFNFIINFNELLKQEKIRLVETLAASEVLEEFIEDQVETTPFNPKLEQSERAPAPRILEELVNKKKELRETLGNYYKQELKKSWFLTPQVVVSVVIFFYLLAALCAPFTIWHSAFLLF